MKQYNETNKDNMSTIFNGKVFVVYYSTTGSTKKVANQIVENLNADLFEIVPKDVYTAADLDWTDSDLSVSGEHNDEHLRNIKLNSTKVDNWYSYDTVFIGYPIWWEIAVWPVDTFVKANNFESRRVIPFCTSASSSLG